MADTAFSSGETELAKSVNGNNWSQSESRQQLQLILEQSPFAVTILEGEDCIVRFTNKKNEEIVGQASDSLIGKSLFESFPELKEQGFDKILHRVLKTGEPFIGKEVPATIHRNGKTETAYFDYIDQPFRNSDNEVTGIISLAIDVTEKVLARKQTEESEAEIRKTKEQLDLSISAGRIGIWHWDVKTNVLTWSREQLSIYGINESEFDQRIETFHQFVLPEDLERIFHTSEFSSPNDSDHEYEFRIRRKDGKIRWINARSKGIHNGQGKLAYITGTNVDVTERKTAEEELHIAKNQLELTIQNVPAAVYLLDEKANILFINQPGLSTIKKILGEEYNEKDDIPALLKRAASMVEYKDELGMPIPQENYPTFKTMQTGKEASLIIKRIYKNGTVEWFLNKTIPLLDEAGKVKYILSTSTDYTEQKNIEKEVKEGKERLQAALNASLTGTFRWNIQTNELSWDENLDRLFGLLPGQTVQSLEKFIESIYPDQRQGVIEACRQCAESGADFDMEFRVVWPDGSIHWLADKGRTYFDEKGKAFYMTGACVDITGQKLLEEKLKQQYEELENIYSNAPIGLAIINREFRFVRINERLAEINGVSVEEHLHRTIDEIAPGIAEQAKAVFEQVFTTGQPLLEVEIKGETKAKPGIERIWRESWHPVKKGDGETFAISVVVEEITERKRAEEALAYQKKLLETVTENTDMALFLMDDKQYCVYMNEAAEEMTGFTLDELRGKQLHYYVHHTHPNGRPYPLEECPIDQALPSHSRLKGEEVFVHKDGSFYPVAFTASPILVDGKAIGTVIEVRDTTEEKKKERALRQSEEQFRNFSNNIQNLAWIADGEGSIFWYNQRWYDYTGTTLEEMKGWGWQKVHHPDHIERVINFVKKAWHINETFELIFPLRNAKGEYRWFLTRAVPITGDEGKIVRWIGTNTDIHEKILAEEKIKKSEEKLQRIFLQAPVSIVVYEGKDFVVQVANKKALELWGKKEEDVMGRPFFVISPELRQTQEPLLKSILQTGQPFEGKEYPVQYKRSGEWHSIYYDFVYQPLLNAEGEITAIVSIGSEVTHSVEARRKIEESENRFRTLAETLPQLVWMTDKDGRQEYASSKWKECTGVQPTGTETWAQMIHPEDAERIVAAWSNSLLTGKLYSVELRLKNKEGEYRWFFGAAEPIKDKEDNIIKWVGSFTDIHEQKTLTGKLEQLVSERTTELSQSKAFLQSVLNSAQNTISTFEAIRNKKGRIVDFRLSYINSNIEFELGTDAEVLMGKTCRDAYPHIFSNGEFEKFVACVENGVVESYETNYEQGGKEVWYFVSLAKMGDGLTATSLNITKEKQATLQLAVLNQQLDEQNKELQRSNEDLQQFAHVASHDLKEPVRKVMTFTNRLKLEYGNEIPEKAGTYLSKIENASLRMYSMIDGVLLYSSLNALEQTKEAVDLNELFQNIETDLEVVIAQKRASFHYAVLPSVEGSPVLFYQLFYNLVNNSLKFAKDDEPPVIEISAQKANTKEIRKGSLNEKKNYVAIFLKDYGIGFTEEEAQRIFGTFTRLHSKDKYEGTGLGLALCRKIAERHGGAIYAEGVEGEGAMFVVILPTF